MSHAKWIRKKEDPLEAKYKLLCIPYAGAGASKYAGWRRLLGGKVDILAVQLPGRENRISEEGVTDCKIAVGHIIEELLPLINGYEFAVFGHSMGGIIGYELIKELQNKHGINPKIFFISASYIAPEDQKEYLGSLEDDDEFIDAVKKYGGISDEMLQLPGFKEYFLQILRNDFNLIDNYPYSDKKISIPIRAYVGNDDRIISEAHILTWREYTNAGYTSRIFEGDHFYLAQCAEELCSDILEHLQK